jgi:hypothetical protein
VEKPLHKTNTQIQEEKKRLKREEAGLISDGTHTMDLIKSPSLNYLKDPRVKSKIDLHDLRKIENHLAEAKTV